jgi:acid phosphatase
MVKNDKSFHPKTWAKYVKTVTSKPIPGSLAFAKYADSKGVKVFYVSNRDTSLEEATRKNLEAYGYPMGGNVDTVLLKKERDDWGSKKGSRRAVIAKDYRILLLIGDNFGDFVDNYKGSIADREATLNANADKWGKSWIAVANPTYGSWESTPYKSNYKLSGDEKRSMKLDAMSTWSGE